MSKRNEHRAIIERRRRQLMTAAFSTVTLSAATARPQVCLSVEPLEPAPCSLTEDRLERTPSPDLVLETATCFAEQEHELEKALAYYQRYLELTADDEASRDQRARIAWTIERLRIVLADEGKLKRPPPNDFEPPEMDQSETSRSEGARSEMGSRPYEAPPPSPAAGPASCGCDHGPAPAGRAAWLAGLGLAVFRRRWSRSR